MGYGFTSPEDEARTEMEPARYTGCRQKVRSERMVVDLCERKPEGTPYVAVQMNVHEARDLYWELPKTHTLRASLYRVLLGHFVCHSCHCSVPDGYGCCARCADKNGP